MEKITSFRQLRIWQQGMGLVESVYHLTKEFPKEEIYGLIAQIKRAVVSVPSNIAEGFKRRHDKEYIQFLYIALGSLGELETQLEIASRLKYCSKDRVDILVNDIEMISKMIATLINRLKGIPYDR